MAEITQQNAADLFFQINWESGSVSHTDAYAGKHINLWRDHLPPKLYDQIIGREPGDQFSVHFNPGELLHSYQNKQVRTLDRSQFQPKRIAEKSFEPRKGRFYPKGVLKDIAGIFSENVEPFRCVQVNNGKLSVDLGHPLAGTAIEAQITVGSVHAKQEERGGTMRDWSTIITTGPGMQTRWRQEPTDFFSDFPFSREDESEDALFYGKPRLVQHLDDTAIDMVRQLYGRFIKNDMAVLDLMSSWQSHMPSGILPAHVAGLGMNAKELNRNAALDHRVVQDLNLDQKLPFEPASFDVVVCTVSVEYLIKPLSVFKEVGRVLKPGGIFAVTFSNRWFPPKVVRIWKELHEFERMGLVLEYFFSTHLFENLHTYSIRGLERPRHDKYYGRQFYADPIYAVWGYRI